MANTKPKATVGKSSGNSDLGSISVKKLGKNLIGVIAGEKFTKVLNNDEDKKAAEGIMQKVELYKKKPSAKLKKEIQKFFNPNVDAAETKAVKEKAIKKKITKTEKSAGKPSKAKKNLISSLETEEEISAEDVERLEKLVSKHKKVKETAPKPVVSANPVNSGREKYR